MAGLVDTLEDSGYTVWWDPGLIAGSNFAREIQSQIGQAGAVIVIWTPKATESDWVLAEVQRAHAREKLLCVRCSDLPLDRVPLPYNALHTIDLADPVRLLAALRRRAIHPSKPERVWDFYGEPIETRRRAMERFQRITAAYLDQIGSRQVNALDPALDVQIQHVTRYSYDRDVRLFDQLLRVHPTLQYTRLREYQVTFTKPPDEDERYHDLFDNIVRRVAYRNRLRQFGFDVSMVINLTPFNPLLYSISREFAHGPFSYNEIESRMLQPYLQLEGNSPRFGELASASDFAGVVHVDVLVQMMDGVTRQVRHQLVRCRACNRRMEIP